jgi:hypothetical protein
MWNLDAHILDIQLRTTTPLVFDEHPGSALRGAIFNALLARFCVNRAAPTCAVCPLNQTCPVSALVAPLRDEAPRGRDVPRPFVLRPPRGEHRVFAADETLRFGLNLFGQAATLFPYVVLSVSALEGMGMGRPLPELRGRRGRFRVETIEALAINQREDNSGSIADGNEHKLRDTPSPHPPCPSVSSVVQSPHFHGSTPERAALYTAGKPVAHKPGLPQGAAQVAARAARLPADRLRLYLLSPLHLTAQGRPLDRFDLAVLVARLVERLDALQREYGAPDGTTSTPEQRAAWQEAARAVRVAQDETHWATALSHSRRTGDSVSVGGLVGHVELAGDLAELRELLVWGELVHVGKNAVKGNGWYQLAAPPK